MRAKQLSHSHLVFHVVFAKQVSDALLEFVRDLPAARDHFGEINLKVLKFHPARFGLCPELADEVSVLEQCLGRNTSPVEASASEVLLLDAKCAFLELPRANRRRI